MRKIQARSIIVFFALLLLTSIVSAADLTMPGYDPKFPDKAHCRVSMAKVNDPNSPLNVRSSPAILPDNIVGTMEQGKWLVVAEEKDGWFRISPFMGAEKPAGWVAKNRTSYSCSFFRETITATPVTLQGFFIGMGSHEYMLPLEKGQTLILTVGETDNGLANGRSPWPSVMDAAGKRDVPESPGWRTPKGLNADETQWTWVVTEAGIYKLSYESNYKGFSYHLTVEVLQTVQQ